MADLDYGELRVYPGNYDEYMTAATQARERLLADNAKKNQRKRTSGKRCNVTQTRREMLRDFRLELRHIHILQLANTYRRR